MRHGHRCRRWWRIDLVCPFASLEDHEEDEDPPPAFEFDPLDPDPTPIDAPRRPPSFVIPARRETDVRLESPLDSVVAEAEEIIRDVPAPDPIPAVPQPVGFFRPTASRGRAGALTIPTGRRPAPAPARTIVRATNRVTQKLTRGVQGVSEAVLDSLRQGIRPPVAPPVRKAPPSAVRASARPSPAIRSTPPIKAAMAEEAVTQEFGRRSSKPHGSRRSRGLAAAAIVGGGVAGGGFLFNAASRMRGMMAGGGVFEN